MEKKSNTTLPYILGIILVIATIFYGLYFKINEGIEFQASLNQIADQISQNKSTASQKIKEANTLYQQFLSTVSGDLDKYYIEDFNKNQFVRTFDKIIQEISTEQDRLIVTNLNLGQPIQSNEQGFESIPVSLELTATKESLLKLLEEFEKLGLNNTDPFYLIELRSLSFRIPTSAQEQVGNPEFQTTLNLNISKTLKI